MSTDLKRIDPKAIPALFAKHDFSPMQNIYCEYRRGKQCACVNTILVADTVGRETAITAAEGLEEYTNARRLALLSGFDPVYAIGLAEGWDGSLLCRAGACGTELLGMKDGRAAWEACLAALAEPNETFPDDDPTSPRSLAERIAYENDDPALQH